MLAEMTLLPLLWDCGWLNCMLHGASNAINMLSSTIPMCEQRWNYYAFFYNYYYFLAKNYAYLLVHTVHVINTLDVLGSCFALDFPVAIEYMALKSLISKHASLLAPANLYYISHP